MERYVILSIVYSALFAVILIVLIAASVLYATYLHDREVARAKYYYEERPVVLERLRQESTPRQLQAADAVDRDEKYTDMNTSLSTPQESGLE